MVAAERGKRGNIEYEVTSGPHHPIHLFERCGRPDIVERVNHVERRDDVENAVGEGQRGCGRLGDQPLTMVTRVRETAVRQIDSEGTAVLPDHLQVVAGSAAAVEDPGDATLDILSSLLEERTHETTKAVEPEMLALCASRHLEKSIHVQSPKFNRPLASMLEEKLMKRSVILGAAAILAIAMTAGACKKPPATQPTPPPATAPKTDTRPASPPPPPPPPAPAPAPEPSEDEIFAKTTLAELNAKGLLGDVFFAYDSAELTPEARATIQKNSDYMKRWTSTKVVVEGHADSRGTNEYNLALAERRADVTRDYMVSLGLPADRLTIVSKGEEEPVCTDENESCWQRNRRGKFVFTAK